MKRLAALLVVVAAGLVAAALWVPDNAATVNGTAISQNSLNTDLLAFQENPGLLCALQSTASPVGAGGNASPTATAATWLTVRIQAVALDQLADRLHVAPSAAQVASAEKEIRASIEEGEGGCPTITTVPASVVDPLAQRNAALTSLTAAAQRVRYPAGELHAYFLAHRAQFDRLCASVVTAQSALAAARIKLAVAAGATLGAATAANGASVQALCQSPGDQNYQALAQYTAGLRPGQVSGILNAGDGVYALFQLTSRTPLAYGAVASEVLQAVQQVRLGVWIATVLNASSVQVDPRYGSMAAPTIQFVVNPPTPPKPSLVPNVVANLPESTAAAAGAAGAGAASPTGGG